ncbi:amidase [Streptomyces jeddahensis]|uniref:Glutamyl-tRNA(Gln) amidotransferase subunit A n=1 Tax=Streptomyces jeddahensis TaxID=1716141 RepID=A0A177HI83_9ACTN|nr:amidase [Streptomyces jeddahensis]OAH10426.1 glutamyl-tRNA(Gln) amidotransferase subunit A [Streptomyces jeddahensis]
MSRALNRRVFLASSAAAVASGVALPAAPAQASAAQASPAPTSSGIDARDIRVDVRQAALDDPSEATLAEAVVLMRRGRLSATDLVQAYLERIERYDSTYQAYAEVTGDAALAAARRADRGEGPGGVLSGIPLCIKDNYFTDGVPTRCNSYIFEDFVPDEDATAVARLTAAGGIVLGKGQMGPLATTRATKPNGTVTTVNAWTPDNPSVDPGGSSTGPACAVAARLASSSIGTQTGGSIVLPSNQQNLTGLKPTMGRVSLHGVIPLSFTRDHAGPLARDAMDAAIMLQVMAGPDARDPRTLGLPDVPDLVRAATPVVSRGGAVRMRRATRIGVPADFLSARKDLRTAFLNTLDAIPGVTLVDVTYPADWGLLTGTFNAARLAERTEPFRHWLGTDPAKFGVSLLSWLQGLMLSGDEWITAQRAKNHLLREVLDGVFGNDGCDVLLQTGPVPFDILGLPEIGFPIGFDDGGVPVGVILGGQPYEEDRLLEVATAYQALTDWHTRRPSDPATAARLRSATERPRLSAEEAATASA